MKKLFPFLLSFMLLSFCETRIKAQELYDSNSIKKSVFSFQVLPALAQLDCDSLNMYKTKSQGLSIGLNYSYYFYYTNKIKISFGTGLMYHYYKTNYSTNYENSEWTTDKDNDAVYIHERCLNLIQLVNINTLNIPVALTGEYSPVEKLSFFAGIGSLFCVSVFDTYYHTTTTLSRTGYYPAYNVTLFDVDVESSPYFYPNEKPVSFTNQFSLRNNISMLLTLGIKFNVTNQLSFSLVLNRYSGLKNISAYHFNGRSNLVGNDRTILPLHYNCGTMKLSSTCIGASLNLHF